MSSDSEDEINRPLCRKSDDGSIFISSPVNADEPGQYGHSSRQMSAIGGNNIVHALPSEKESSPKDNPLEACGQKSTAIRNYDDKRDFKNESQNNSSILSITPQATDIAGHPSDDGAQKQAVLDILLVPGSLEDLLAQWTTLSQYEIQRAKAYL
jgi:hypothetical protein